MPGLPGEELPGVVHGLPFLREMIRGGKPATGTRVVVIGGGFTAVDCVRMARRGSGGTGLSTRRRPGACWSSAWRSTTRS